MALLPLFFHKSALKLNTPVFHLFAHPALSHVHPLNCSQEQLCFLENKGKESPVMSDEHYG